MTASPLPAILERVGYPGGKAGAGVYQRIVNLMPPHGTYIEPFLGGGALMRLKRPARLNIGVDLDPQVIEYFTAENDDAAASPNLAISADIAETGGGAPPRFRFVCGDAIEFLSSYDFDGSELVYCDPPYLHSTRARHDLYRFEMSDRQHRDLLAVLRFIPAPVIVSGYWSEMYAGELRGWEHTSFQAMTRGGHPATEHLWFNFDPPAALHDYSFLGADFRERERIKRKKDRWLKRLQVMPLLERQALLAAIAATIGTSGDHVHSRQF